MAKKMKNVIKVLIMGLDNSGKTSILLNYFKKELNLMSFFKLRPTKGMEITELEDEAKNMSMVLWDFGGQEEYRNGYLKKLDGYLPATSEIIFVVDIQDKNRYDEAAKYFASIMNEVKMQKIKLTISLYFHKFDPNLEKIDVSITNESIISLAKKFAANVPLDCTFEVSKTSIYTFFRKTSLIFNN